MVSLTDSSLRFWLVRSPARKHIGALPTHMEENGGAILEKSELKVNDHSVFFFTTNGCTEGVQTMY